jgi:hypothetical protein
MEGLKIKDRLVVSIRMDYTKMLPPHKKLMMFLAGSSI